MIHITVLSLFSFVSFLFLDYFIRKNYLGNSIKTYYLKFIGLNYFVIAIILFVIFFVILMLFSYFDVSLISFENTNYFNGDNFNFMTDSASNKTIKAEGNININNGKVNIHIPGSALNNFAAAASVSGGGALAVNVGKHFPGSPGAKLAAAGATFLTSQALTVGVAKILNANNNEGANKTNKLINWFNSLNNNDLNFISTFNDKFNDYPFNLLPEIDQLATAEILFLLIIFNIFIVQHITSIDFNKYLPNNKVGNLLKIIIARYIKIWSKSAKFLLIFSWVALFVCVLGSKFFLYFVLNS